MSKTISFVRTYFQPIQPTVSAKDQFISYKEILPSLDIQDFIFCFWELKTLKKLEENFNYRVVSDGCIDIFMEYENPKSCFIMGFCRKYTEFPLGKSFHYFGIRFLPTAFPTLFQINAQILSNQSQPLHSVDKNLLQSLLTNFHSSNSFEENVVSFNHLFEDYIENISPVYDGRFLDALQIIFQESGLVDIETDLNTGLSPRHLRRFFNYYLGTTPKAFSNVVRFQQVLRHYLHQPTKPHTYYLDAGYFDQAHFIKHFKTFYGVSPSHALL